MNLAVFEQDECKKPAQIFDMSKSKLIDFSSIFISEFHNLSIKKIITF